MIDNFVEGFILWIVAGFALTAAFAVAFMLLKSWLEKTDQPLPEEYFFPHLPRGQRAELSFGKIHYIEAGSGPCLILIHGLGASVYTWRLLMPMLAKNFRVIALDLPGFGLSDKRLDLKYDLDTQTSRLEEFLKHLKISKCDVVGSSMGGLIGLWLAFKSPELVGRYVGLSPALNHRLFPFNPAALGFISGWSSKQINAAWMRRILSRVLVKHLDIDDDGVNAYLYPYHNRPDAVHVFIKALATVRDRRIPFQLVTMTTPILLLHGERDHVIPVKISKRALKYLPTANLKILADAGHHIQEDNPEWVSEKINSFFKSIYIDHEIGRELLDLYPCSTRF